MHIPVKTEYKGHAFDSKSEAVFARTLDLARKTWTPQVECNGHVWDFCVHNATFKQWYGGKIYCGNMLIEYKPAMPTNTYVDNLTNQMSGFPEESIVVWGNPWDGIDWMIDGPKECCYRVYPIYSSFGKYGWGDFNRHGDNCGIAISNRHPTYPILGITEEMAQKAKNYRFDLA